MLRDSRFEISIFSCLSDFIHFQEQQFESILISQIILYLSFIAFVLFVTKYRTWTSSCCYYKTQKLMIATATVLEMNMQILLFHCFNLFYQQIWFCIQITAVRSTYPNPSDFHTPNIGWEVRILLFRITTGFDYGCKLFVTMKLQNFHHTKPRINDCWKPELIKNKKSRHHFINWEWHSVRCQHERMIFEFVIYLYLKQKHSMWNLRI